MSQIIEKQKDIQTKRGELDSLFGKYRDDTGNFKAIGPEVQTEIVQRNDELKAMQDDYNALLAADTVYQENQAAIKSAAIAERGFSFGSGGGQSQQAQKSLGQMFVESQTYQRALSDQGLTTDAMKMAPLSMDMAGVSMKTLMATTAGYAPFVPRTDTLIYTPQRRPVVSDLIPQEDVTVPGTRYMEETLFTNNAGTVAEGALKPESALQLTERLVAMTKIATTLPVTEEQLMDAPQIRAYIDNRLGLQVKLTEETQLLQGNGTSPNMTGFLNKTGILTQPKGAYDDFAAILAGIVQVESTTGFANVTGGVVNPNDWFAIRTKQDSTGRYILGDPGSMGEYSLWGKTLVPTIAEPVGTILIGDFATYSQILRREGLNFRVGLVNNQLVLNQMTIVAEERLMLLIYRAAAFCLITGTF